MDQHGEWEERGIKNDFKFLAWVTGRTPLKYVEMGETGEQIFREQSGVEFYTC